MPAIELTPFALRTLGAGVTALRKGDDNDCGQAAAMDAELRALGYCHCGNEYIPRDMEMLVAHIMGHSLGYHDAAYTILTAEEKNTVLALSTGMSEIPSPNDVPNCQYAIRYSSPESIVAMGEKLREIRCGKGLTAYPA